MSQLPPPQSKKPQFEAKKFSKSFFGKEKSLILGGFAILLMIWHHLFNSPDWYSDGVGIDVHFGIVGRLLLYLPAATGDICVQIFAIISGYALFINPNAYGTWKSRGVRLLKFMTAYWLVLSMFLIVGYYNGDDLPSYKQLFHNMFGLETGPKKPGVNVPFAWYVAFYIQFVLFSPFLIKLFDSRNKWKDAGALFLIASLVYLLPRVPLSETNSLFIFGENTPNELVLGLNIFNLFFKSIHPFFCVGLGIIAAKYNLFYKLHQLFLKKCNILVIGIFIVVDLYIKYKLPQIKQPSGSNWWYLMTLSFSFIAFFLVACFLEVINRSKSKIFLGILSVLGSLSMYLWFLHGIFFTGKNFLQVELFATREPIVIFLVCLLICTPIAFILSKFHAFLWSGTSRFYEKRLKTIKDFN